MIAIISDIHGNLEALTAVLEDIARNNVAKIYCLGDLVGYGPNPRECVDLAMGWDIILQGNFDSAVLAKDPRKLGFGVIAGNTTAWSQGQLSDNVPDRNTAKRRIAFLNELSPTFSEGEFLYVHGSPRHPLNEYVFPEDIHNKKKMEGIFALVDRYCFMGHTHVPGVFVEDKFLSPGEIDGVYKLDGRKTLVNVGSVGQPRDGDPRACYVLLRDDIVRFRRVEYDIETTIKKIRDDNDLDNFSGDRLASGR